MRFVWNWMAAAALTSLLLATLPATARAEQHGDGYGPRDEMDRPYGGGQGQIVLLPPPYYVPSYPGPAGYGAPVYGYGRPLPALRPPVYAPGYWPGPYGYGY